MLVILGTHPVCSLRAYTGKVKPWVVYSLVRIGAFAIVFALLMLFAVPSGLPIWAAAIIAAIIGLCIGYIFFGKLRDAVALDIVARRTATTTDADSTAEDALER